MLNAHGVCYNLINLFQAKHLEVDVGSMIWFSTHDDGFFVSVCELVFGILLYVEISDHYILFKTLAILFTSSVK